MVRKQLNVSKRLKASSLIEVVVSMVIILLVFAIAMGIYTNILRLSLSLKKYHAQAALYQVVKGIEKSSQLSEESFILDGFYIKQKVTRYQNQQKLKEVHLTAMDENELNLAEFRKVLYETVKN